MRCEAKAGNSSTESGRGRHTEREREGDGVRGAQSIGEKLNRTPTCRQANAQVTLRLSRSRSLGLRPGHISVCEMWNTGTVAGINSCSSFSSFSSSVISFSCSFHQLLLLLLPTHLWRMRDPLLGPSFSPLGSRGQVGCHLPKLAPLNARLLSCLCLVHYRIET